MNIKAEKKPGAMREISIEGKEFLSEGVCGECFKISDEEIVKLYREGVDSLVAIKEKQFAKLAFVLGIPTAISYDIVKCGNRTGVVYELLNAELLNTVIDRDFDNVDYYAKMLSDLAKSFHNAKADPTTVPSIKASLLKCLDNIGGYLQVGEAELLRAKIEELPIGEGLVHFDLHAKNVMLKDGEPMVIDLGDLSIGHYLYDVALIFWIYATPELDTCNDILGMSNERGLIFWEHFSKHFFEDKTKQEYDYFYKNRHFLATLRLINAIDFLPMLREGLAKKVSILLAEYKDDIAYD